MEKARTCTCICNTVRYLLHLIDCWNLSFSALIIPFSVMSFPLKSNVIIHKIVITIATQYHTNLKWYCTLIYTCSCLYSFTKVHEWENIRCNFNQSFYVYIRCMCIQWMSKIFIIIFILPYIAELKRLYSNLIVAMILIENQTCIRFKETDLTDQTTDHVVIFILGTERYVYDLSVKCISITSLWLLTCTCTKPQVNVCINSKPVLKSVIYTRPTYMRLFPFNTYFLHYTGEFVLLLVLITVLTFNMCHCIRIMEMWKT